MKDWHKTIFLSSWVELNIKAFRRVSETIDVRQSRVVISNIRTEIKLYAAEDKTVINGRKTKVL